MEEQSLSLHVLLSNALLGTLKLTCIAFSQAYLTQFNELYEEMQGKRVGVFGITAQLQDQVDFAVKELNIRFQVGVALWVSLILYG